MQVSVEVAQKRKAKAKSLALQVGDRVTFEGSVLRVLPGADPTLLIMVEATRTKLTIKAHWFKKTLRGSDPVRLTGTVTRLGDEALLDRMPVTVAVDGYTLSRVTLSASRVKGEMRSP